MIPDLNASEQSTASPVRIKDHYRTTRILYLFEACFEYLISLLLTGAYIAKVASVIGLSDSMTGIVTSLASLGTGFQGIAVFLTNKTPVKRWVTAAHLFNQLFFTVVWLIPLFPMSQFAKTVLFFASVLLGFAINHTVNSPKINWFMSAVDDNKRGVFTAWKESISLCAGSIFVYIMGGVFDYCEARDQVRTAFLVGALTLLGLTVLHTLTLIFAKEKPSAVHRDRTTLREVQNLFHNKQLMSVVLIGVLYSIFQGICYNYYGSYQIKELGFSMSYVAILSVGHTIVRCVASIPLGKYADRTSFAKMLKISFFMLLLGEIVMVFTVPSNGKILYGVYYMILHAVFGAGYANGVMNLVYDTVDKANRVEAFAVYNCISGLSGFLFSFVGSAIVSAIQRNGNVFFGYPIYAQQFLSFLSVFILAGLLVFLEVRFRLSKDQSTSKLHK